jgi:2-keto-4-pentenoate hydratase/2-oxohepta-3-ene-1,7-dioic acid hydratase in catechol pathway
MRTLTIVCLTASVALAPVAAQKAASPFKLGTFMQGNRTFLGLVVNDATVVDLSKADPSLPTEMKLLLQRYQEVEPMLSKLAASVGSKSGNQQIHDVATLKTLAPVMPQNILNAAVNYTEHAQEMAGRSATAVQAPATPPPAQGIPGIWERKPGDTRHNPYVFPKMVGAVIGNGDAIRLPPGRDRVDWECELAVVIGRTATRVSPDRAADFIFGYTLQNDVSDRAARPDGRHGSTGLSASRTTPSHHSVRTSFPRRSSPTRRSCSSSSR